jgi:predicted metalloprotease with PDZ domain
MMTVYYTICPTRPETHLFQVQCRIPTPDSRGQRLWLPDWIPGSYLIRDFARNIIKVRASSAGRQIGCEKTGKSEWLCAPVEGELLLDYEVYAYDMSVRGAYLDNQRGFFNATSVFLAVGGQEHEPCEVLIQGPGSASCADWKVATAMSPLRAPDLGFGYYRAADYDELIDHPVELGNFDIARFEAAGVPHFFVLSGRHQADIDRICSDLKRVCETHARLFGGSLPMDRYWFLTLAQGDAYGGLEHRASTALVCKRDDLPRVGVSAMDKGYRRFLGLCSHEYFHSWNVKRIKPAAFSPYRLDRENYTRQLWVFEGITSYYDDLGLVRSGVIKPEGYLELLAQSITRVLQTPGRFRQSLADSSFDAWTKFYKQDENSANTIISYYVKGALVALALDLMIRQSTDGKKSLDHVMAAAWERFGLTGKGVPEDDFEALAQEVSGLDLKSFFDSAIRDVEDLPLGALLQSVGIGFSLRPAENASDQGGLGPRKTPSASRVSFGMRTRDEQGRCKVAVVLDSGPAQLSGVSAGDELVAVNGLKVSHASLELLRSRLTADLPVTLHLFRRDELMEMECTPRAAPAEICDLFLEPAAKPETVRARERWLGLAPG